MKQKIAEKEAAKAARGGDDDLEYDEDSVLDPREKARLDREREIKADLDNAAALFGAAGLGGGFLGPELDLSFRFGAFLADPPCLCLQAPRHPS